MSKTELRKAAVLLLSLSDDQAAGLLARLEPREARAVADEMRSIESIADAEQSAVLLEFAEADAIGASRAPRGGTDASLAARWPTEAGPFAFLTDVDCHTLVGLLVDERPQTIALVASHVPSAYGAALVAGLDVEQQLAVVRALASMEPIDPDIVANVAQALAERVSALV